MKKPGRFSLVYILFFMSTVIMLIIAVIFSFYINNLEREMVNGIQNHLRVSAYRASTFLTPDELDLFHTIEDTKRPEWNEIRAKLQRFAEESRVLYVYYWRITDDGNIQYIIDNDENEEYMVTPDLIFPIEDDPFTAAAVSRIRAGESWVTNLGNYTASWDGLISAAVPVFNDDGTVYCAAGVDLSDEIIINMHNIMVIMRYVLVFSLLLSFLAGFLGMRSYDKKAVQSAGASLSKSRFLSTMSHEMRTPLNAIIGMTAIGKRAENIVEKNRSFEKIDEASSHMLGVINDVLDMAKIEANKLELSFVDFSFEKMIQKVVTVISYRADEKQQTLTININENVPKIIIGDDQRLAQVITNLLSNAVKFTPEGGYITLFASLIGEYGDECELRIDVVDTGIGISPEQQRNLFKSFGQAESETSRKFGGTGLGLDISKRIVELMGGRIWIESELGKGSSFIFTIKARRSDKPVEYFTMQPDRDLNRDANSGNASGSFEGMRMLIVEDIEINREILNSLLANTGLLIENAENGEEAVNMVKTASHKYDIILMDVQMPVMDGFEATGIIRSLPGCERGMLPIIAMTAHAFNDDIENCLNAGMDDHLSKPLDVERIFEVLYTHLITKKASYNTEKN